jgi:hypothetical protein
VAELDVAFRWAPIEDLPSGYESLASPELRHLALVWEEQRVLLAESAALGDFNQRLQREWAIETGVIEGVYSLDVGVTELLIERGIDASLIEGSDTPDDPHLVAAIIRDHLSGVESLFDFVSRRRDLSVGYVKELHALMTQHQESVMAMDQFGRMFETPLLRGEFKKLPNNPRRPDGRLHEYAPPEHVDSEMDRLVELHHEHTQKDVSPELEAAWLHHRFTQIHPFQDANGRVARALASLILIRAGWFPLLVTRNDRGRYIDALEEADAGSLGALVGLFARAQRKSIVGALSIAGDVLRRERVDQVIEDTRDLLQRRREELTRQWQRALDTANDLQTVASDRFEGLADRIEHEVGPYFEDFRARSESEPFGGPRDFWFRRQIIETAKTLDYFANPGVYRSWVRLVLRTNAQSEVLLSFHGIGHEYRGVLAVSMCFFRRAETETGEREVTDVAAVSDEVFQINYQESSEDARPRFQSWMEQGLARALEAWRQGL